MHLLQMLHEALSSPGPHKANSIRLFTFLPQLQSVSLIGDVVARLCTMGGRKKEYPACTSLMGIPSFQF